jgi:hypothetical protein
MVAHRTFKEQHDQHMQKANAAEARLRTMAKTSSVARDGVYAVQVTSVQAVALYGKVLWWDLSTVGRPGDLQLRLK